MTSAGSRPNITTDEAFETLLTVKSYWMRTGKSDTQRRQFLHFLQTGSRGISLEKKIELLKLAGFGIKQEMAWTAPNPANEG